MAIVKEYISDRGNHIKFSNDAYINCTEEEIQRRKKIFDEACYKLIESTMANREKNKREIS